MTNLNLAPSKLNIQTVGSSLIVAISALFLMVYSHSAAATLSAKETVTVATQQVMLSQRIAKAYFFLGLSDDKRKATLQLEQSIKEFELNHKKLIDSSHIQSALSEARQVKAVWRNYKSHLESTVNKEDGKHILQLSDKLLDITEKLVAALVVKMDNKDLGTIISLSGKQSMLSQRLAKLSYAQTWGVAKKDVNKDIRQSMRDYHNAFSVLMKSEFSNKGIQRSLRKVKGQSSFAEKSLNMAMDGRYLVNVIESTTDKMLNQMDDITQMYTKVENLPSENVAANKGDGKNSAKSTKKKSKPSFLVRSR